MTNSESIDPPEGVEPIERGSMARAKQSVWKNRAVWASVTTAVMLAGVGVGAWAGYRALSRTAGAFRGMQGATSVRFNWPVHETTPTNPDGSRRSWLPVAVQKDLCALVLAEVGSSTTDAESLARAAGVLERSGWFHAVTAVRRADRNAIEVLAHWRTPVAVVRVSGPVAQIDRLISDAGELLPVDYPAGTTGMRYLIGASQPAPLAYGDAWAGDDVQAGLRLLGYLHNSTAYAQVAGIDVSRYAAEGRLTIVTDSGGRVVWGAAPDDWAPSEPSPDQKLKWLVYLRSGPEYGRRIDAGRPLVDVTNPRGIMIDQAAAEAGTQPGSQGRGLGEPVQTAGR